MKKWAVSYTRKPTNYNQTNGFVVEAETKEDAQKIVQDRLRDFNLDYVYKITPYEPPPAGWIIGELS